MIEGKDEKPGLRVGNLAETIFHAKGTQVELFLGAFSRLLLEPLFKV